MNCKTFVFALGLLLVGGSCVYAQNKGKNITKAVEGAITKKVPVNTGKLPTSPGRTPIAPGKLPNVAGKTGLPAGANVPGSSVGQKNVNVSAGTSTSIVRGADIAEQMKKGPASAAQNPGVVLSPVDVAKKMIQERKVAQESDTKSFFLSRENGKSYLEKTMDTYMPQVKGVDKETAERFQVLIPLMYDQLYENVEYYEGGVWQFTSYVYGQMEAFREHGVFPKDFSVHQVFKESPDIHLMVEAITFREYAIKHGSTFPTYNADTNWLHKAIHNLWRSAIMGKLPIDSARVVMETFWACSNRGLEDILQDVQIFAQEHGHLPGINILAMPGEQALEYLNEHRYLNLTDEERHAVSLGMELVLVTKMLPQVGWKIRDPQMPARLQAWSSAIDQEVKQMQKLP